MKRAILAFALILAGCTSRDDGARPSRAPEPIEVALARPEKRDVARETQLPVELWAWQRVSLIAKVSGYVGEVPVDRGSVVKAGETLAKVSVPELEDELRKRDADLKVIDAEITSARASWELQKVTAKRFASLVAENAVSVQELDEARAREKVAEAAIAQAEAKRAAANESRRTTETWLSYATIAAPFSGVVTERLVHPGSFVSAAERTPLFTVLDRSTIRAVVDVPEAEAPRIHAGQTRARVTIPELGRTWSAVVARSATSLEPRTRTLRIEVDLANETGDLVPGMYGQAALVLELHAGVTAVPSAALARGAKESAVFIIRDGKAHRTVVTPGLDDGKWVEIRGELEGDLAAQARGLSDGAAVKLVEAKK